MVDVDHGGRYRRLAAVLDGVQQRCAVVNDGAMLHAGLASAEQSRVSSWPLGDPIVYNEVVPGEDHPGISPEEAEFFKENGFLVKVSLAPPTVRTQAVSDL